MIFKIKKKHKYVGEIWAMREQRKSIVKKWNEFVKNSDMIKQLNTAMKTNVERIKRLVAQLQKDLIIVEQSGRSISLAANSDFIKYFIVKKPFFAAFEYQLQAKTFWTILSLNQINRNRFKKLLNISLSAKQSLLDTLTPKCRKLMSLFGQTQCLTLVIS